MSKYTLYHSTTVTDWSGQLLSKKVLRMLQPGCIVRVCVMRVPQPGMEAIYVKISKIKDGTVWGIVQDTYRLDPDFIVSTGNQVKFRLADITEIPITWQPKRLVRKIQPLLDTRGIGRDITGCF